MFSFFRNIQSYPTPILFIKKRGGELYALLLTTFSVPRLIAGELRTVVINIGSFAMGTATESLALTTALLRTVVINVGTFAMGTVTESLALTTALLRTVVINIGTFSMGTVTESLELTGGELRTVVRNVGTWTNTATESLALTSASLSP